MQATRPIRAAQYVRMSTEHQNYSVEFQSVANAAYALEHGFEIVRTYADAGISGLDLAHRPGLKALLADVTGAGADYSAILVYDVSRWGRFQDPDEAAHYEFICRSAGVVVRYCAEPFDNDGSLTATLVKHLKRAMAAEYSRELSAKIARAKRGLAAKGYWTGGAPGFGYRRCALPYQNQPARVMNDGERQAIRGPRVTLVLGPEAEVATVRRIFSMFVDDGMTVREITAKLNREGVPARNGSWRSSCVRRILNDRKCMGTLSTGHAKGRLEPRGAIINVEGACPAIVGPEMFASAQARLRRSKPVGSTEQLLDELRDLLLRKGRLSFYLIEHDGACHSPCVYVRRFGSLSAVYELVGYHPSLRQRAAAESALRHRPHQTRRRQRSDAELWRDLELLYEKHGFLSSELISAEPELSSHSTYVRRFGGMEAIYKRLGYEPRAHQLALLRGAAKRPRTWEPLGAG